MVYISFRVCIFYQVNSSHCQLGVLDSSFADLADTQAVDKEKSKLQRGEAWRFKVCCSSFSIFQRPAFNFVMDLCVLFKKGLVLVVVVCS